MIGLTLRLQYVRLGMIWPPAQRRSFSRSAALQGRNIMIELTLRL